MDTAKLAEIRDRTASIEAVAGAARQQVAEHAAARARAVAELRADGHSWGEIAAALGVTRSRVQQYEQGQPSNAERRRRRARRADREG